MVFDINAERSVSDLRAYFGEDEPLYTGRRFESLAGGGDTLRHRYLFTAEDLVAVQLLSVQVPGEAAINLLDGELAGQLSDLLARIPTGVELGTSGAADLVGNCSPADQAWHLLTAQDGIGWVIAGKLMARKRPHLIPVYDQVIACMFGEPKQVWLKLHACLAADGGRLRDDLAVLRGKAGLPDSISLLRILDVILWMSHRPVHVSTACPGHGSFPLT